MNRYKAIILAGGSGTRLYPITKIISKQLLPVYDKSMIYYPLSTIMKAGINEVLIISTPEDTSRFKNLLGDGSDYGIKLSYKVQNSPDGIAQAFIIAEDFLNGSPVCLILGDNLYYGADFSKLLQNAQTSDGATVFAYQVANPGRYGVVEFDENNNVLSIKEKPLIPKSKFAVTGLYFYDANVVKHAKTLIPSARNELEITDLNNIYLKSQKLRVITLDSDYAWFDMGTSESLLEAANFIESIEHRQGVKIACLEEIALNNGWVTKETLKLTIRQSWHSSYYSYVKKIINE